MPNFDKNVDYLARIRDMQVQMNKMHHQIESCSQEYLSTLQNVVVTHSMLSKQIRNNSDKLI